MDVTPGRQARFPEPMINNVQERLMKIRFVRWKEIVQLIAFVLFFVLTVALNLSCSEEDSNPAADVSCGSGRVTWEDKGQVCRDLATFKIVPSSCCGR